MIAENPSLVVHPHALVGDGRVSVIDAFQNRETLGAYIKRTGVIVPAGPVVVWHNGYRVPDALWRRLIPRTGDQVVIRARVLGGGGGGKILRTVAMIALVVLSAGYGAALGGALGFTGSLAASVGSSLIMIGGTLLINALLPPPTATAAQLGTGSKYESSPTYAISGGRNRARPWEPMTIVFGRHKVVPDYGANYYTQQIGDDQYLSQIFHFGVQDDSIQITDHKIGDTPIDNYQGVSLQMSGRDGNLSMFPGNVDSIQGFLLDSGVINSRTTAQDVTHLEVEVASALFYVNDSGEMQARSVDLRVQYRPVGGAWVDIGILNDAVYATHYWALFPIMGFGAAQQIEFGSTNYGEHVEGQLVPINGTVAPEPATPFGWGAVLGPITTAPGGPDLAIWKWMPHPHSLGKPWQGIAPDPLLSISSTPGVRLTGSRQEPTRQTIAWNVPKGQYEVRVWKVSADIKSSRESNETAVSQILAFQTDDANYYGQRRMAMRIKATAQLNGAVDEYNAIASAMCPSWNGSTWSWTHNSNPAWWFLWFALGKVDVVTGNRFYGAMLLDTQIDVDSIKAWGAWCDAKGLTFNYVLDRKMSSAQVLQMIARAGRASPTWQAGKLGAIWNAASLPVVAMFGPFNIKAGSFKVDYINEGTADEIVLNFINPTRGWQMDEVRVKVPGSISTNNPLQLDFDGCTDPEMAGREANLLAASQVWHRRRVSWETDIEGWVASRGDVVQMSHDLTVWGYSGRLIARAGNVLTLDGKVPSGGSGTMMLRDPDGIMKTVTVTSSVGETDTLTITSSMAGFPLPGDAGYEDIVSMDWAWFFDPMATPGRRFKIIEVNPSEDGIKFSAIDDDAGYYASEDNPYIYTPPRDGSYLGGVVFAITFVESIVNVQADITNVQIGWAISAAMPVDVGVTINGVAQPVTRTSDLQITVQAKTGDKISVTVTPRPQSGAGTPGVQSYIVQGLTIPLPAVTGLTNVFRDGLTVLTWDRVTDIRNPDYEVRRGSNWDNARTVGIVVDKEILAVGNGLYWVAARFASRGLVVYGPPDSLKISGATLVRNVLAVTTEHPLWSGDLGGGAFIHDSQLTLSGSGDILDEPDVLALSDVLWYGGAAMSGTYETNDSNIIDIGFTTPVRVDFDIDEYAFNFHEDVLAYPDVFDIDDILNESNKQHYKVQPQTRHSDDGIVWSEWADYVPGLINARFFDVRLVLTTDDEMIVPFVTAFTWTVDVPDMIQREEEITVIPAGLRITYTKEFHAVPNVQIATFDAVSGDRYVLKNSDKTGFNIRMYNGATAVQRKVNWISQGY